MTTFLRALRSVARALAVLSVGATLAAVPSASIENPVRVEAETLAAVPAGAPRRGADELLRGELAGRAAAALWDRRTR